MLENIRNSLFDLSLKTNNLIDKLKPFASTVLRIGLSLVILWFGYQQISDSKSWIGYLPEWTASFPISAITFIYLNAIFELIFGSLLLAGLFTRTSSLLLALHMLEITYVVGFDPTGVRDFGITVGMFAIFLFGSDNFSLDRYFKKQ